MFLRMMPAFSRFSADVKWSDLAQKGADCWDEEEQEKLGSLPAVLHGVMVICVLYSTLTQIVL